MTSSASVGSGMESRGCQTDKVQHRRPSSLQPRPIQPKADLVPAFHPISKHLNRTYSQKLIRRRRKIGRHLKCLWVFTPLSCLLALSSFASSVITSDWLRTEEKMPNLNRTILFGPNKSPEYLPKFTVSGLFKLYFTLPGKSNFSCINIDYFPTEPYQPDQNDSTMSIPYAVIHAAWFFFAAGILMSVAGILCLCGHCVPKKRILTFMAGVVFIFAGLSLFIGQVVYIAIFKAEVGSKLVPLSLLSPPRITYQYGWSFLLLVASFLSCEAAGVAGIFLYMHHHQYRFLCRQDESRIGIHLLKNLAGPLAGGNNPINPNGDIIRNAITKAEDELEQQEEQEDQRDIARYVDHKHIPTLTLAEVDKRRDSVETNPNWAAVANGCVKSLAVVDPFRPGVSPVPMERKYFVVPNDVVQVLNGAPQSQSCSPPIPRNKSYLCARHRTASLRRQGRRCCDFHQLPKPFALDDPRPHGSSSLEEDEDDGESEPYAEGDDGYSLRIMLRRDRGHHSDPPSHNPRVNAAQFHPKVNPCFNHPPKEGPLPKFHQCCQCVHCGFTLTNPTHGNEIVPDTLSRPSIINSLVGPRECLCDTHSPGPELRPIRRGSSLPPLYPSDCGLYELELAHESRCYADQDTRV